MKFKMRAPLQYMGGKTRACGILAKHMPKEKVEQMSSIFCGGLSFELYCENELGIKVNKAYDLNPLLINLYNTIKTPELAERIVETIIGEIGHYSGYNKELYNKHKEKWKKYNKVMVGGVSLNEEIDPFEAAVDYYITHSFSRFLAPPYNFSVLKYGDERMLKSTLKKLLDFRTNMDFECAHFQDSIPRHNNEFLYLDPPYYVDNKNLKTNLYFGHAKFNHELLSDLLKAHKSKFLLSYNDCEFVRDAYKDFNIKVVEWNYSVSQALKKHYVKDRGRSYEVIIANYDFLC